MTKTRDADEFEDWARLAVSIGQYTQRSEADAPRAADSSRPGGSKPNGSAVNGHQTANGHVNGNGVKVDQLPGFLLQGPADDDELPASEPDRVAPAERANGATGPGMVAAGAVPAPFLLTDALSEDLEIPPEPATPPMGELQRPIERTVRGKAKNKKERSPAATRPSGNGSRRQSRRAASRKAKAAKEQLTGAVKKPQAEAARRDFDDLRSSPAAVKRVGISAPPRESGPVARWRHLEDRLKKGATVTAVGVTLGGVAVAILYIVIIATTTVL